MSKRIQSALAGAVSLLSPAVWANPYNVYGASPQGTALGGAVTGSSSDASSSFYNPAGLGFLSEGEIEIQFLTINPNLTIQRLDPDSTTEEAIPQDSFGINLAIAAPIIKEKLSFGATLYVPSGTKLLQIQALEPQRPQFYMYQSLHNRFEVVPSFGYRPIPQLSIGAGVEISTKINAVFDTTIFGLDPNTNEAILQRDLVADADILASPIVGVAVQPIEQLKLGFAFRGKNDGNVVLDAGITTAIDDLADVDLIVDTTSFFVPSQLSFGASYQLIPQLTLMATVDRDFWSQASNPESIVTTVVDVNGEQQLELNTAPVELGFIDVLVPRFGIEATPLQGLSLRAGYFFRPTHIPVATNNDADSNLLDNDVHVLSFGAGYKAANPFITKQSPLGVDFAYQLQSMVAGAVGKEDPNDPVGNLGFGGQVHSLFFSLSQSF